MGLMLSRRAGDAVILQTDEGEVLVTVQSVSRGGLVRLHIEAPPRVTIMRRELIARYASMREQAEREEARREGGAR